MRVGVREGGGESEGERENESESESVGVGRIWLGVGSQIRLGARTPVSRAIVS